MVVLYGFIGVFFIFGIAALMSFPMKKTKPENEKKTIVEFGENTVFTDKKESIIKKEEEVIHES